MRELLLIRQKHLGSDKLPEYISLFTKYLQEQGVETLEIVTAAATGLVAARDILKHI